MLKSPDPDPKQDSNTKLLNLLDESQEIDNIVPVISMYSKRNKKLPVPVLNKVDPDPMDPLKNTLNYARSYHPVFVVFITVLLIVLRYIELDFVMVVLILFLFFYLLYQARDIIRTAWVTPPCDFYSVIVKKENVAVVRKAVRFNDNELTKNDPFYKERNFKILDLRTETEDQASHFNFKVLCKVMDGDETVLAEIDSDSHITIICESYFEKHLKETVEKENRFLEESPPRFKGINGPWIVSKYPP